MYRTLIFFCLWHVSLSVQNITEVQTLKLGHSENGALKRITRASRPRGEKPVDCQRLHGTDDSAFVAIILNQYSGRLLCMGSIIDERHILTAVPCVLNIDVEKLRVLVGYFKAWWGRHSYVFYVEKVFKHEHDLAILRLSKKIEYSRTIRPIRLLQEEEETEADTSLSGQRSSRINETIVSTTTINPNVTEKTLSLGDEIKSSTEDSEKGNPNNTKMVENQTSNKQDESQDTTVKEKLEGKHEITEMQMNLNETNHKNHKNEKIGKGKNNKNKVTTQNEENDKDESSEGEKNKKKKVSDNQEEENGEDPEGSEVGVGNFKVYRSKKLKKISKRNKPGPRKQFMEQHPKIKKVLLVGFPLSRFEVMGEPISQTIIYGMKEELVKKADDCVDVYHMKPRPKDEEVNKHLKDFCTPGDSKFCWGCLGGPTLYKKENEYIQVGVVGGTNCDDDSKVDPYLHIRVDIHMKWILANSLIPPKL